MSMNFMEQERFEEIERKLQAVIDYLQLTIPEPTRKCRSCRGEGRVDVSYHGSARYEECDVCKGTGIRK